jgi:hypothetical protein
VASGVPGFLGSLGVLRWGVRILPADGGVAGRDSCSGWAMEVSRSAPTLKEGDDGTIWEIDCDGPPGSPKSMPLPSESPKSISPAPGAHAGATVKVERGAVLLESERGLAAQLSRMAAAAFVCRPCWCRVICGDGASVGRNHQDTKKDGMLEVCTCTGNTHASLHTCFQDTTAWW